MKISIAIVVALANIALATDGVTGAAEGFAAGVTGGGDADPVYPTTTDELISYLGDSEARVIILDGVYDFTGTEGTSTGTACTPWGTESGCQVAINKDDWCDNYQPDADTMQVSYDNAGVEGITVGSNKSIVGKSGSKATFKGKGIRIRKASNVIVQNVAFTDINPEFVWGGDAITLDGTDMIWIDHVTTSDIGRQHLVLGEEASGRVTVSNNYFDGHCEWSATCDNHHYWGIYFTGSNDKITLKNNYIYHMSGRSPKVAGSTLLHAVNNYWFDYTSEGHAFEVAEGGMVLAEGNVFKNVPVELEASTYKGKMYVAAGDSACMESLGRSCPVNIFEASGELAETDTTVLDKFEGEGKTDAEGEGKTVAACEVADESMMTTIPSNAGNVL